ncbi:hypothetical protein BgiMline_032276 [Biomphalaria glabrata]|uniref:Uncharacterized protein LOC106067862 n=1 Tax=Biomphalaria glabrata TaxID=6526 RepID=A0A9W2YZV1_BIOGL|nr:uncharacterized protein LOC106067862 [Biomphalaria glabrata]XP_055868236.1 uncharacterized protein LOC106067862 [Biomphalaria glabrata]XP_055868237.1 uncharacterized protein LOC106067862 [Biomphalaria glabrata]XP_055868238.1 uncharacterized protein LOC106067862 [Biomphalaria glabrata]XP_055868239.1 uncharacterized protein LOC106067862 [Biomphalaria glabrata]XP_055868240.1 uncharacterized protein LOC106067862 [Biomphalaria glabrata]KAI8733634.1 tumor necrosis factor ligand superfamily membe
MPPNRYSIVSILSNSSSDTALSIRTSSTNPSFIRPTYPRPLPEIPDMNPLITPRPPPPVPPEVTITQSTLLPHPSHSRTRSRSQKHCYLRRRTLILLSIFSFALSIAAVIILTTMLVIQTNQPDAAFPEGAYEACLKCIILKQNPDDTREEPLFKHLHNKVQNGELMCCARTSVGLSSLLQLMTRRLQNVPIPEPLSLNHYKFSPVSAHVAFKNVDPSDSDRNVPLKFDLEISDGVSQPTHAREVTVTHDTIRILHTGWYYVYSSVYFNPPADMPCQNFKYQTWGNNINKINPQKPDQSGCLAKTAHTCCNTCVTDHHSSFTGGVFHLTSGDRLFVDSSADGIIKYDPRVSYFGLVMLGTNRPDNM